MRVTPSGLTIRKLPDHAVSAGTPDLGEPWDVPGYHHVGAMRARPWLCADTVRRTRVRIHSQHRDLDGVGDLDEVATGVVEHRGGHPAHVERFLREPHSAVTQPLVLSLNVVNGERGERDAVLD